MKYNFNRKLGKFGPSVSPIGFGAMSLTNFYGPCNDNQANDILKAILPSESTYMTPESPTSSPCH